ncbi:MAG TPA: Gfo/Idh/MocA family oxidoreductase, partial [Mycobacteriales bacterium]|nr:Gfo/Idh/MocA family oxidoreductase [Mycobacteriales bacterium]
MRFGLFGTGPWAHLAHAPALADHQDVEFVGVWGRDPGKAGVLAAEHGARPYEKVEDLLGDVDAVAIALPPDVQAPLAARAARAGRHLFLDKPIALTTAAADAIVDAVTETGVRSVVFFTNRFKPSVVSFLREAIATGGWDGGRATLLGSVAGTPYDASPWRHEHGGLWDVGPHALSVLLPVLGPVVRVTAAAGPHQTSTVLLAHEGGAVSTMVLSLASPVTTWDVTFYGESGWTSTQAEGDSHAAAVAALTVLVEGEDTDCDVVLGRDIVAILESAAAAAGPMG